MSSTMRPALRIENPGHVAASTITLDYEQNRNSLWMYGVSETSPIPLRGPHPCMFVVSVRKKTYGKLCEILRINTPNMP
ncbi:MAG: hypothetical protein LBI29_00735 [Rickettsiales bacterium]|nr:hypothetical protein [Rickettsiales bacterium]